MSNSEMKINAGWNFDNSYARLPGVFYSEMTLNPVSSPSLVKLNYDLAKTLGLNTEQLQSPEVIQVLSGNEIPEGGFPLAQAYAGHQFGHPTMLGDGRAMLIGEHITPTGDRVDVQLKGSGRTPYSRGGDGRAALKPMLREYIISEAMHGLGIPTTRSLAVLATGEKIVRETDLPGAILTRVAASHLRVGTFQYAASLDSKKELKALADYAIDRHFPTIEKDGNHYLAMFKEVIKRQAILIAKWQLVGFIHGVMNTDNMTISGETIDYGPCAFMDTFHLETVFSSIDVQGRYAYGNQPKIAGWNLARFAEALLPLLHDNVEKAVELAQNELYAFNTYYQEHWLDGMRGKLGLQAKEEEQDAELSEKLLGIMQNNRADFTDTFRFLALGEVDKLELSKNQAFIDWHKAWKERIESQEGGEVGARKKMKKHNPVVIPRNHLVEAALDAAEDGDLSVMEELLQMLSNPYAYTKEQIEYGIAPQQVNPTYKTYCGT
ncbi:protein adenylyltransferase SelO [Niallia sp. Sow4_A1]|uniref:Protein nucleotidyltransferase YdiU n=1 Tax=Niallia hominis TaxID=3133173 RepID=A0ABV1F104_9BACI